MKIAVLGIGGVGGFVGGVLARVHPETSFFVHGENLKAIRRDGLTLHSAKLGDFTVHPQRASEDANELGPMDAIIMACKGPHLDAACRAIAPMVHPQTLVVPLLNGVFVSERMKPLLPPCILADGVIYIFSHLERPGVVKQTSGPCRIILGMQDGSRPPVLLEIVELLNRGGAEAVFSEDILRDSWRKYVRVCSLGIMCCYYDGPAGKARRDPNHKAVLRGVVGEMIAVAQARGVALPIEFAAQMVDAFDQTPSDEVTSLYRDLASGKPVEETEFLHLVGRIVEMGREFGIPTPYHDAVYQKFIPSC